MQEIDRIIAVPYASFDEAPSDLVRVLTEYLRVTGGTETLRPWQARALQWASDYGRLFVDAPPGSGKTILSFLLPVVCNLQRPLLVIPAALREDTRRKFRQAQLHWRVKPFEVLSYSQISCDRDNELLDRIRPDGIILDEAHLLANLDSGRTRKLRRWIEEHDPQVFPMSGTPYKDSLDDVAHVMGWSLKEFSPMPRHRPTLYRWRQAIDPDMPEQDRKMAAGIAKLERLPGVASDTWADRIRKRVRSTPGYAWVEDLYEGPLAIASCEAPYEPACLAVLREMRATGLRPDGEPIEDGLEMWRHAVELWFGYWGKWDPPPPQEWRVARRDWCRFVRKALESETECDTPMAIANAIDRLDPRFAPGSAALREWRAQRPTYDVVPVAEWIRKESPALDYATRWLYEHPNGLIWMRHVPAAKWFARALEVPYFGEGQGESGAPCVEDHEGAAVLSVDANVLGRNLQFRWRDNLVLAPPSCGVMLNQLIARTHRIGQQGEVTIQIVSPPGDKALGKAVKDLQQLVGPLQGSRQKLLVGMGL